MAIWIATLIVCVVMGAVAGLIETVARGDVIPNWHIMGVGIASAVIPAIISLIALGGPIWHGIIAIVIVALIVDRTQDRMKLGL
ncbi:MAG: hypothetical protein ACOCX2_06315 [Armatimonadota bacterium]